jgi:hypothetical protein
MLAEGAQVAWAMKRVVGAMRVTVDFSPVHRLLANGQTYCGRKVPPATDHVSDGMRGQLEPCERCNRFHALGLTADDVLREDVRHVMQVAV